MIKAKFKVVSRGFPLWFLNRLNFSGFTWFNGTVWIKPDLCDFRREQVKIHEARHIYQINRDGFIKFTVLYIYDLITVGYKNNRYEVDARNTAKEILD